MTGRATTQAISATEPTEGERDAVRIRHQLDAWANASNRTPRLVAAPAGDASVESSGEAPLPATKRSRASPASGRTKAAKGTKAKAARTAKAKMTEAETTGAETAEVDGEPEASNAPLEPPTVSMAPAVPEAVPAKAERARASRAFALVAALALATVAAYFSVAGMAEIFPGAPVAVMVLAATMEAGKLVIAGWLAAHWRRTNWKMRFVMVALVAGLALINAAGVFGKLVEAHVSVAATSRSGVTERIEALDARVTAQTAAVADLDSRIAQIDRAVDESTRRGRVTRAINIATQQRLTRDGLDTQRQAATATLVGLQSQRAALAGERSRIEASAGPIQYLAMMVGAAPEVAVRWLILLMVLCCDPAAIALTVAAAGSRARDPK
jgi:cell division protein FtsB